MIHQIGITYDLRSDYLAMGFTEEAVAEFDSDRTLEALHGTLLDLGYEVERIGHVRNLVRALAEGRTWDLVFNIAEGIGGRCREAQVPAILEAYGIPYTFADPLICALTLDKAFAKRVVAAAGLNTPRHIVGSSWNELEDHNLLYPLFVKPNEEGTGKGIDSRSRVDTPEDYRALCLELLDRSLAPILVEEFLPGREFTTAVLGTGNRALALGTMEVTILNPENRGIYSYETKENCDELVRYTRLEDGPLKDDLQALALAAYRVLECRDAGRVDLRLDRLGKPSFIEVNPLAGLMPGHSDLPMIAGWEGVSYPELIRRIIESASERCAPGRLTEPRLAGLTDQTPSSGATL
ncbi:MAG TPA: D-alanine--D-alanine ligase [Thermoanaerobaculia bacterium]|nr:D-alanine--D-alanine ligase [Thermoanaerobaculia bacterium]HUM29770.1 D-alanine--D-alanine ligase [Thermoanaerobaculia bacterium]HXK67070.1 D-alanine--D-alanine ligase [Thermoanaerobaculia bacterium]